MNPVLHGFLDTLRWISAFFVVSGHLRSFLFVPYEDLTQPSLLLKLFYFITGLGHQGVIVFFLISGYLVGGNVVRSFSLRKIDTNYIKSYMGKRFVRIYLVLIPALLVGCLLDLYSSALFPELYSNEYILHAFNFSAVENITIPYFIGNILNLQTLLVPPFGSNAPLWSLAYGWVYYLLFPLLFINGLSRLIFITLILFIYFLNPQVIYYALIWGGGVLLVVIRDINISRFIVYLNFIIAIIVSRFYSGIIIDYYLASALFLLIHNVIYSKQYALFTYVYQMKISDYLARFSYTTYLFHFPFIVFFITMLRESGIYVLQMQPTFNSLTIYIIFLSIVYMYSYLFYLFFESRTKVVHKKLFEDKLHEQ